MTTVAYCRSLSALGRDDAPRFGGKSASLGELLKAEIAVPPGFGLSIDAFQAFVSEAGIESAIDEAMARAKGAEVTGVGAAAEAIKETMLSSPIPQGVRGEVEGFYAALGEAVGGGPPAVAIRSSAVGEDGEEATFADQQETFLWVHGIDEVCDAIRACWASLYSPEAISYRARLGARAEDPAMGVTVQAMVDAGRSGVMFTCNPLSGDPSMVAINASWGLGLAVVGGEVTPDDYLVSKVTGEIVRESVNPKAIEYVPDPDGNGAICQAVGKDRSEARCLDDAEIAALVEVGRRVERHFESRQDIEWAMARDGSGSDLFVVQSRPVTGVAQSEAPKARSAMSLVMRTFGAPERGE